MKLYEGRDSFDQEASSFERAQIVRLDSRQISMIRFHLGTGYEDVYIPVSILPESWNNEMRFDVSNTFLTLLLRPHSPEVKPTHITETRCKYIFA